MSAILKVGLSTLDSSIVKNFYPFQVLNGSSVLYVVRRGRKCPSTPPNSSYTSITVLSKFVRAFFLDPSLSYGRFLC